MAEQDRCLPLTAYCLPMGALHLDDECLNPGVNKKQCLTSKKTQKNTGLMKDVNVLKNKAKTLLQDKIVIQVI